MYVWNLSIASILILTFSNIILTIRLLHKNNNNNGKPAVLNIQLNSSNANSTLLKPKLKLCTNSTNVMNNNSKTEKHININFNINLGRWDSQRLFKLYDNIIIGERYVHLSNVYNVCLATQSSVERLSTLVQVALHWSGPISVAVYAAGNEELHILFAYIHYLQHCYSPIREQVVFHLLLPKLRMPTQFNFTEFNRMNCRNPHLVLLTLLRLRTPAGVKWRIHNPYPQNHLRNLARKNCQAYNIFVTDIDIIPSYGMAQHLNDFLKVEHCTKPGMCAYVIPTYEIDDRVNFPANKSELLRLNRKRLALPFHEKVFIYNQYATNISKWQEHIDPPDGQVHISHSVTNFEFFYEPFYVATDIVPLYDERFIGYGYTRNTQVYEMFVAGYKFVVLSPIFTCHWGIQLKRARPHWREIQNTLNGRKFEVFKREIFARYNVDPLNMMKTKTIPKIIKS